MPPHNKVSAHNRGYLHHTFHLLSVLSLYHNPYPYVLGLLMNATHRITMIPMKERERGDENSTGFTFKK